MLNKDLYEYLCYFVDDKTIINLLSVNRKYNECYEIIVRRKYTYLVKFKKDTESWKNFFVKQIFCILKLEENYGIPYFPTETYNPCEFYFSRPDDKRWNRIDAYEYALKEAVKTNISLLKQVTEKFEEDFDHFQNEILKTDNYHIWCDSKKRSDVIRRMLLLFLKQDLYEHLIICIDYFERKMNQI